MSRDSSAGREKCCARRIVRSDRIDRSFRHALPQRVVMVLGADRRHHLHEKAVGIVARDAEIGRRGLDREAQSLSPGIAHHFESLAARKVHHVEMCAGDLRQVERGLDCKRLGIRRMRKLPVGQGAFLLLLQLVTRTIDQGAGFTMNASDRISAECCHSAKAVK